MIVFVASIALTNVSSGFGFTPGEFTTGHDDKLWDFGCALLSDTLVCVSCSKQQVCDDLNAFGCDLVVSLVELVEEHIIGNPIVKTHGFLQIVAQTNKQTNGFTCCGCFTQLVHCDTMESL